jgi:WD40 repeat protein
MISGAIDGQIHTWDLNPSHFDPQRPLAGPECVLFPIKSLSNYQGKGEPTRCVAFNPKHAMMASASHDLVSFFSFLFLLLSLPFLSFLFVFVVY